MQTSETWELWNETSKERDHQPPQSLGCEHPEVNDNPLGVNQNQAKVTHRSHIGHMNVIEGQLGCDLKVKSDTSRNNIRNNTLWWQ